MISLSSLCLLHHLARHDGVTTTGFVAFAFLSMAFTAFMWRLLEGILGGIWSSFTSFGLTEPGEYHVC